MLNFVNIKKFKNIHLNDTCVIVGTGPSLKDTDLSFINKFKTFGVNNGYKLKKINYDYFCVQDEIVWENEKYNIFENLNQKTKIFIRDNCKNEKKYNRKFFVLKKLESLKKNSIIDIEKGIWKPYTVVGMCMQIAYYMGFKNIVLIGCDCFYQKSGNHHFDGSKVKSYLRTNWKPVFNFYKTLKNKMQNTFVCNCTEGGFLEVFPRMDFKIWNKYENDITLKLNENMV